MAAQEAGKVAEYAVKPIGQRAVEALGMGFDLTSDFKLNYVKGGSERLVALDETNKRDIVLPACPGGAGEGATVRCVPEDIRCDKGEMLRFKSDVLEFNQMSELINQKSSVQGKVPSGYFNAMFDFSGSWLNDGAVTKRLAFDGYFVAFYYLHLSTSALVLHDKVKKSVPSHWDPASLSSFIKNFGTHVVVGMAIGGQDLVCVRQEPSSMVSQADLKANLDDLGDALFTDDISPYNIQRKARGAKQKDPDVFNSVLQSNIVQVSCVAERSSKDVSLR